MGYDIPFFPTSENALDKDVQYQISGDGKELTISLPYEFGGKYDLENSDPESFVLKESRENGDTYLFVFSHEGTSTEKIKPHLLADARRCGCFNQRLSDNGQF